LSAFGLDLRPFDLAPQKKKNPDPALAMDADVKDSFIAVHFENDHLMGPVFLIGTGSEQRNTLQWTAKFSSA